MSKGAGGRPNLPGRRSQIRVLLGVKYVTALRKAEGIRGYQSRDPTLFARHLLRVHPGPGRAHLGKAGCLNHLVLGRTVDGQSEEVGGRAGVRSETHRESTEVKPSAGPKPSLLGTSLGLGVSLGGAGRDWASSACSSWCPGPGPDSVTQQPDDDAGNPRGAIQRTLKPRW